MGLENFTIGTRPLVGVSQRTKQVLRSIDRVAQGRWPVLILGETGTGKEVVARSIQAANPDGPFVTIDCSSLVGPLMESELFGHTKGAFTSAAGQKTGLLELADGGTAFFDEIGELPLDMQCKLLRALQEKEFRPVGSAVTKRSDFRIIAATNRDLAREVERGTFRRDLYYRLNVVTIKLAPLRERQEDILPLAQHFLEQYGMGHELTREVMDALETYTWPGNVRELENCVQQMVAMNSGPAIHSGDLPSQVNNHYQAQRYRAVLAPAVPDELDAVIAFDTMTPRVPPQREDVPVIPLQELEKREIIRAIRYTQGDRNLAAHLLGIGRTTLYRKLKEYAVA